MPKCYMFENGITINPRGKVRPCCVFDNKDIDMTIDEEDKWKPYFEQKDKEMAASDAWIPECNECELEERALGRSLRTRSFEDYERKQSPGRGYWDLKITNTCNLWCRMCSGGDSTTWVQHVKNNPDEEWAKHLVGHDKVRLTWHDTFLPKVKEQIIHADIVKFTGGEPMLVKHVKDVINHLIDTEFSYGIRLLLTTNVTQPWTGWWEEIIPKFKKITVTMSIDGIGERFEYQRQGASWAEAEANALHMQSLRSKYENFVCNINYTNTAINAACKAETEAWAKKHKITWNEGGVEVYHPYYMSYRSLPDHLRERFGVKGNFPFDPKMLEQLKKQMAIQDKIAGTDFASVCPEFFE